MGEVSFDTIFPKSKQIQFYSQCGTVEKDGFGSQAYISVFVPWL